jgi:hypothetical protein
MFRSFLTVASQPDRCFYFILTRYEIMSGFGGLGAPYWPLVPKFVGSNPAEKFLSTPSFGAE